MSSMLEEILVTTADAFALPSSVGSGSAYPTVALEEAIERAQASAGAFSEHLDRFTAMLETQRLSPDQAEQALQAATHLLEIRDEHEYDARDAYAASRTYEQELLTRAGAATETALHDRIAQLHSERRTYERRFLGRIRFRSHIGDLEETTRTLRRTARELDANQNIPTIPHDELTRFEDAQAALITNIGTQVIRSYDERIRELTEIEAETEPFDPSTIRDATRIYLSEMLSTLAQRTSPETVTDDPAFNQAVDVIISDPPLDQLERTLHTLPPPLSRAIASEYLDIQNRLQEFDRSARTLEKELEALPLREAMATIDRDLSTLQHTLRATQRRTLPYDVERAYGRLENLASNIEERLRLTTPEPAPHEINLEAWSAMRAASGAHDALDRLHRIVRSSVFETLLTTPEHTNTSVKLGYRALRFTDPQAVAYNLLNFFREPGVSGDQPFFSIHDRAGETIAVSYLEKLSPSEQEAVEQSGIPGLSEAIRTILEDSENVHGSRFEADGTLKLHDTNLTVQRHLAHMIEHYLLCGSDAEASFAGTLGVRLSAMNAGYDPITSRRVIEALSTRLDLDDATREQYRSHHRMFNHHITMSTMRGHTFNALRPVLTAVGAYTKTLDELVMQANDPRGVRERAKPFEHDALSITDPERDLPKLIAYLEAFDDPRVLSWTSHPEYSETFATRESVIRHRVLHQEDEPAHVAETIIDDITRLGALIDETETLIEGSSVPSVLRSERDRLLKRMVLSDTLPITGLISGYLNAINDPSTAVRLETMSTPRSSLERLVEKAYELEPATVTPLVREAITNDAGVERINEITYQIAILTRYARAARALIGTEGSLYNHLERISTIGSMSEQVFEDIDTGALEARALIGSLEQLAAGDLEPTPLLIRELARSEDPDAMMSAWAAQRERFAKGGFDPNDELHRSLEYTRFRRTLEHPSIKPHLKSGTTLADYERIFDQPRGASRTPSEEERFEIECVAHEAHLLKEYASRIVERASLIGRPVMIVPNLSYGFLPSAPILEELEAQGVIPLIGAKIGSTESHNNKEVTSSTLFSGHEGFIAREQPVIIVVDGTKHLAARDKTHKAARYPDAYQGYLNQTIAMNDALGAFDIEYVGKSAEDLERLRSHPEHERLVRTYRSHQPRQAEPYRFGLWNTAGEDLIIRNYHERIGSVPPLEAEQIRGPTVVFCNVGVHHKDIPEAIRTRYQGHTHRPAYFDDSGRIVALTFSHDEKGVHFENHLESLVKEAYGSAENGTHVLHHAIRVSDNPVGP